MGLIAISGIILLYSAQTATTSSFCGLKEIKDVKEEDKSPLVSD